MPILTSPRRVRRIHAIRLPLAGDSFAKCLDQRESSARAVLRAVPGTSMRGTLSELFGKSRGIRRELTGYPDSAIRILQPDPPYANPGSGRTNAGDRLEPEAVHEAEAVHSNKMVINRDDWQERRGGVYRVRVRSRWACPRENGGRKSPRAPDRESSASA